MTFLSFATFLAASERPDPNAFVWLFYLGFVLLVGGCCAYLSALFSFGGVARNYGALVAVGLYMFLVGGAFVLAFWFWGAQDPLVKQDNAFLGIYFAGLALLVIGAALVVFSRLLPVSARVPLPDILTPGLFAVLGFVPALVLAFLLATLSGAVVALIRTPLSASAQKVVDDSSSLGPIFVAVALTLLIVLLRRGVHAPLHVKLLAVAAATVVTLALFLRGPANWNEPPVWGFDILILALVGTLVVYFVSRNLTAPDKSLTGSPAPATTQPAPQQATPAPTPPDASAAPGAWEQSSTGE